jgi:hypothetical protein
MSTPAVTSDASAASRNPDREASSQFLPSDKNYRMTGELPDPLENAGTQLDQDEHIPEGIREEREKQSVNEDASAASAADTAAASAAADAQKDKGKTASESRWAKLSRENREIREENARLKAVAEERAAQRETKQEPQPAAEADPNAKPKPDDIDAKTGKPKFKTWAQYEDAKDAWITKQALREFQETSAKTAKEQEAQHAQEAIGQSLAKKFEPVRAKYADFDAVALNPDLVMPFGSVADLFIQDSEHAGEVAYYLGQHPEVLEGFYGDFDLKTGKFLNLISPQQQFRKLMEIENTFSGSAKSHTPSAKPVTAAPRPPNQVSSKGTVAKDAVEQAVEENDTETYMREQNARALARLKKGK